MSTSSLAWVEVCQRTVTTTWYHCTMTSKVSKFRVVENLPSHGLIHGAVRQELVAESKDIQRCLMTPSITITTSGSWRMP